MKSKKVPWGVLMDIATDIVKNGLYEDKLTLLMNENNIQYRKGKSFNQLPKEVIKTMRTFNCKWSQQDHIAMTLHEHFEIKEQGDKQ